MPTANNLKNLIKNIFKINLLFLYIKIWSITKTLYNHNKVTYFLVLLNLNKFSLLLQRFMICTKNTHLNWIKKFVLKIYVKFSVVFILYKYLNYVQKLLIKFLNIVSFHSELVLKWLRVIILCKSVKTLNSLKNWYDTIVIIYYKLNSISM